MSSKNVWDQITSILQMSRKYWKRMHYRIKTHLLCSVHVVSTLILKVNLSEEQFLKSGKGSLDMHFNAPLRVFSLTPSFPVIVLLL